MNKKIIFTVLLAILLLNTIFVSVSSTNIKTTSKSTPPANLPIWNNENYWKYDMSFDFTIKKLSSSFTLLNVDANIDDMCADVDKIVEIDGEDTYKLDLDGSISGIITVPVLPDAGIRGDFGGNAYICTNSLAMKKFTFKVEGEVQGLLGGWHDLSFNMDMEFDPQFDFFDFPIEQDEGIWQVDINEALLTADVYLDVGLNGYTNSFENSMSFIDNMSFKGMDNVNGYEAYLIGGDWGDPSNLWYAPEAGFLAKVEESIFFIDTKNDLKIQSDFNLDLTDTNFDTGNENNPPNEPRDPIPANHATDVNIFTNLRWTGGDPDQGDTVTYDVYFGTDSTPDAGELKVNGQSGTTYNQGELNKNTTYYWKIIAFDNRGESTEGNIWEFTTGIDSTNNPPSTPKITGSTKVKIFEKSTYNVVSTDPDGDDIIYLVLIKRNGVNIGGDAGLGLSGEPVRLNFSFPAEGNYEIKVKATDNISGWSDWGTLSVLCPKNKATNILFLRLLEKFLLQ